MNISRTLDSDSFENPDTNLLIAVDDFHRIMSFQKKYIHSEIEKMATFSPKKF